MSWAWIILTWNRPKTVVEAFLKNWASISNKPDQLIWVDNGSQDKNLLKIAEVLGQKATTVVRHVENLGVSKGYNTGMVLARTDLIAITGCDRVMPERWADRMIECFDRIPETGSVACYSEYEREKIIDRYFNGYNIQNINGLEVIDAEPFEARMWTREMMEKVGYFHEGFGLYGYEDCHWGPRFKQVAAKMGKRCFTFPDFNAVHLGDSSFQTDMNDQPDYVAWKKEENDQAWKWELVKKLEREGYPRFTPYV